MHYHYLERIQIFVGWIRTEPVSIFLISINHQNSLGLERKFRRALTTPAEDPSVILSTHVTHSEPPVQLKDSLMPLAT